MEGPRVPHTPGAFDQDLRLTKIFFRPVHSQPESVSLMVVGSEFLTAKLSMICHLFTFLVSSAGFFFSVRPASEASLGRLRNWVTGTTRVSSLLGFAFRAGISAKPVNLLFSGQQLTVAGWMAKVATKISAGCSPPNVAEYLMGSYKSVKGNPRPGQRR